MVREGQEGPQLLLGLREHSAGEITGALGGKAKPNWQNSAK